MKVISANDMRLLENAAMAGGVSAEALMEQAGLRLVREFLRYERNVGMVVGYVGKGHNAGDVWVMLRHLRAMGWKVMVRKFFPENEWATLTRKKAREAGDIEEVSSWNDVEERLVLLDGLLGIGGSGAPRGVVAEAIAEINDVRIRKNARTVAIDVPSGLHADTGVAEGDCVTADLTISVGYAKRGLVMAQAVNHVGRLRVVPLDACVATDEMESDVNLITADDFPNEWLRRPHDFHKGQAGRVAIIAGSAGMEGAGVMAAAAALRVGAGLVTLFVPDAIRDGVAARCRPEIMVRGRSSMKNDWSGYDACVVGPGLGEVDDELFTTIADIFSENQLKVVVDADALNAIAERQAHGLLRDHHVLTPHPGEFARLAPTSMARGREDGCKHFTDHSTAVLLLKGARTLVKQRGSMLYANGTGHSGMATAGMGDVLAGTIGGLMAQGGRSLASACCGAWLCGRAGELAVRTDGSPLAVVAMDLLEHIPQAMAEWGLM